MKPLIIRLSALALMSLITSVLPSQVQSRTIEMGSGEPYYDAAKEITIKATVARVLNDPSPGMIIGSHLLLETPSGPLDASLGKWGLEGRGALSVATGDRVEVVGVMKTLRDKEVLVVRFVKMGSQIYTMRNRHGIQLSPRARQRANEKPAQKSDSL
jgi:hypothetical protein